MVLYGSKRNKSEFMPTATTSTPTVKATAPKKRVRKAAAPKAKKSVAKITKVKSTEIKRPSTSRLITFERYSKDIQTRWQIHQFEIQELIKDFTKAFNFVKPYHTELVKMIQK